MATAPASPKVMMLQVKLTHGNGTMKSTHCPSSRWKNTIGMGKPTMR